MRLRRSPFKRYALDPGNYYPHARHYRYNVRSIPSNATTVYVSPAGSGDGSGSDTSNEMSLATLLAGTIASDTDYSFDTGTYTMNGNLLTVPPAASNVTFKVHGGGLAQFTGGTLAAGVIRIEASGFTGLPGFHFHDQVGAVQVTSLGTNDISEVIITGWTCDTLTNRFLHISTLSTGVIDKILVTNCTVTECGDYDDTGAGCISGNGLIDRLIVDNCSFTGSDVTSLGGDPVVMAQVGDDAGGHQMLFCDVVDCNGENLLWDQKGGTSKYGPLEIYSCSTVGRSVKKYSAIQFAANCSMGGVIKNNHFDVRYYAVWTPSNVNGNENSGAYVFEGNHCEHMVSAMLMDELTPDAVVEASGNYLRNFEHPFGENGDNHTSNDQHRAFYLSAGAVKLLENEYDYALDVNASKAFLGRVVSFNDASDWIIEGERVLAGNSSDEFLRTGGLSGTAYDITELGTAGLKHQTGNELTSGLKRTRSLDSLRLPHR